MKFSFLSSILAAVLVSLVFASQGLCGLVLNEGDSYSFEFTSLPYDSEYMEEYFLIGIVYLKPAFSVNPSYRFSIYENSLNEIPIRSEIDILDPLSGGFGYLEHSNSASWQDLQGVFSIEVLTGSIELESFVASTIIGTGMYSQTFNVPIPNSFIFISSGLILIICVCQTGRS